MSYATQPRRGPDPLPALTPEQIAHKAEHLYQSLTLLVEALDLEKWDARWTNRLMQAWLQARNVVKWSSKWTPPEAVAASDSATVHAESDAVAGVGETTAAEASRNPSSPEA